LRRWYVEQMLKTPIWQKIRAISLTIL